MTLRGKLLTGLIVAVLLALSFFMFQDLWTTAIGFGFWVIVIAIPIAIVVGIIIFARTITKKIKRKGGNK